MRLSEACFTVTIGDGRSENLLCCIQLEIEKETFHSFFATFLYENETPGLEQAVVVTMATRVLRPLKRAFLCIPPECLTACKI